MRPERMLSIHEAMNGAWSLAARRSRSCAQAAIDTTSLLAAPGIGGGGSERLESGNMPEAGAGAIDPGEVRAIGMPDGMPDGIPGADGTLALGPIDGVLEEGGVLARAVDSGASVGGGTNARLAIVREYYR